MNNVDCQTSCHVSSRLVKVLVLLVVMIILLLGLRIASAQDSSEPEIQFDQHWTRYLLAEHGCPFVPLKGAVLQPIQISDCTNPPRILADEKARARELAKKVFGLVEPSNVHPN